MNADRMYQMMFSPQYVKIVEKRVNKGAKFLDRKLGPDWFRKITTGTLALDDPYMCVLGQAFKTEAESTEDNIYADGFNFALNKFNDELDATDQSGADHGFNVPDDEGAEGEGRGNALNPWTLLGETWLAKIRQLKKERPRRARRLT